jgi:C4-dicarboxylate-specific signal transduction histidine kinase
VDPVSDNTVGVIAILSVFVFFPVAFAFVRMLWKRSNEAPMLRQPANDEVLRRMAELQQSMDAMSVEIERISEGQRFVTKLMSERPAAAIEAPRGSKASKAN